MGFLISLLGFIDPISKITGQIADWANKKVDAQTERERIEADERIKELDAKRAVLIADSSKTNDPNPLMRGMIALPVIILFWKLYVWDKVVGSLVGCSGRTDHIVECKKYTTDALDANLWWVITAVVCFYLVTSAPRWFRR